MSLIQFLIVLRARYRIVLIMTASIFALALAVGFALPKTYTADTKLFFDLLAGDVVGGNGAPLSANSSASYLPTQMEILTSDAVAQQVVRHLHLDRDPTRREAWLKATKGKGEEVAWIGRSLLMQLDVTPKMDSNIVTVSFQSDDPVFSAQVANAFATAYMQMIIDMRNAPARETVKWLGERVASAQADVERAKQKVVDYQRANSIVTADERIDSDTARIALLSQQLVALQGLNADTRSKLAAGQASNAQDAESSRIRSDIVELQAKMAEAATNLGTQHPVYLQMQARLAALQGQRIAEQRRASGVIRSDSTVGKLREEQADASLSAQTTRALEATGHRAELQNLMQQRDDVQALLRDISQKYAQASLLANSVQTNVSIMAPATEPVLPSSPSPARCGLLGLLLGILLGVAAAFGCELADRRVRSDDDIADILGAPVLGAQPMRRPSTLMRVVSWSNA